MLKKSAFVLLILYFLLLIGFYFFQEKVIFQTKKLAKNYSFTFNQAFEEVNLETSDNGLINALHFKVKNSKGVLLYFHGNKGNLERWGHLVQPYTKYEYDVFVIDYRGYGKSSLNRSEKIMYDDAQLAYEYLKERFSEDQIVIYGRSLGATFATFVASQNNPKKLVLEAPFYSLISTMRGKFPLLPYKILLKYKFESFKRISKVSSPTVIFHGDTDALIDIKWAKKLYDVSNKSTTEFITIKGGTHHNLTTQKIYQDKLKQILD